jgi:S-adenosylmethionine-diacylglycerol 3-amino-3-carboxypropyl transferase
MSTEIGQRADFSQLRYAQCWEDADLLLRALTPLRHHRLLSIASAGDNTLALLAQGVQRVVAVDLSVAQIASLELRVAAYRRLEYPEAMQLLGVEPHPARLDLYATIRSLLSTASQSYWDSHAALIDKGLVAQGRFERYLRIFSRDILPLIHPPQVRHALLQRRNLMGRCKFYTTVWDTWRWRLLFRLFFSRPVMGRLGRDPAFFRYAEGNIATTVMARTRHALTVLDPARNPYLQWILLGRHGTALPFALRRENYQSIRRNLKNLEWHTQGLEEYLSDTKSAQFDGFNLSNVFEYMSLQAYHNALEEIVRVARPNARLVYWNLLAPRRRPMHMADRLLPLDNLASVLHRQDHAFFYNALVIEQVTARR